MSDAWIQNLDPFYQDPIQSYVHLNCIARAVPLDNLLPQNIWACHENKMINYPLVHAGIIEVSDLLLQNGSVDYSVLQNLSIQQGSKQSVFLLSISLQQQFKSYFHLSHLDGTLPLEIFKKAKNIIRHHSWWPCTLTKWEIVLQIPPLSTTDVYLAFKRMVQKIKISKLWDCNYKILHRILANPAQILHIRKQPQLAFCMWCGHKATLDHIMTSCVATKQIHDDLVIKLGDLLDAEWIFIKHTL